MSAIKAIIPFSYRVRSIGSLNAEAEIASVRGPAKQQALTKLVVADWGVAEQNG
jgi:hypothetical protein